MTEECIPPRQIAEKVKPASNAELWRGLRCAFIFTVVPLLQGKSNHNFIIGLSLVLSLRVRLKSRGNYQIAVRDSTVDRGISQSSCVIRT